MVDCENVKLFEKKKKKIISGRFLKISIHWEKTGGYIGVKNSVHE